MEMRVKIEGLDEIVKKLDDLTAKPLRGALNRSALLVEREAKLRVPVDTGRLRASITHVVDPAPVPTWAQVGTNVKYAKFVHEGTKPHWPPPGALKRWAKKHGFKEGQIRRLIGKFGTKKHPYLKEAFEAAKPAIEATLKHAAEEIKARWRA